MTKKKDDGLARFESFIKAARELVTHDDFERFKERVRKLAKVAAPVDTKIITSKFKKKRDGAQVEIGNTTI